MSNLQDGRNAPVMWLHSDLDDFGLTANQFRVYCRVVRRVGKKKDDGSDICFESVASMAEGCKLNQKTIRACLKFLVDHRFISIHTTPGKPNTYRINDRNLWIKPDDQDNGTPTKKGQGSKTAPLPKETSPPLPKEARGTPTKRAPLSKSHKVNPNKEIPSYPPTPHDGGVQGRGNWDELRPTDPFIANGDARKIGVRIFGSGNDWDELTLKIWAKLWRDNGLNPGQNFVNLKKFIRAKSSPRHHKHQDFLDEWQIVETELSKRSRTAPEIKSFAIPEVKNDPNFKPPSLAEVLAKRRQAS